MKRETQDVSTKHCFYKTPDKSSDCEAFSDVFFSLKYYYAYKPQKIVYRASQELTFSESFKEGVRK